MNVKVNLENSQIPLHYQLADYLLIMLEKGEINVYEKLPTEENLGNVFGVSRTTVRKAMDHLLHKGLIYRKQGRGSFWTEPARKYKKEKLSGINREIFRITQKTVVKVLEKKLAPVPVTIADELKIPHEADIIVFKRLRFAEGEPMSFTVNYVSDVYGDLIQEHHLEKMTMLESLEKIAGITLGVVQHEVEITRANQEIAKSLRISNLDPVLTIKTSVFDDKKNPVEVVWTYFVENKYRFRVMLDNKVSNTHI